MFKIIKEEDPDLIISVHRIISIIISSIKARSDLKFKYVNVVTDLITLFRGWGSKVADLTFAPTVGAYHKLIEFGLEPSKIEYPYSPINPALKNRRSKKEIMDELGFEDNLPVITITGGGVGTVALKKAVITKPIGEQEKGNIDFALESNKFKYIGNNWDLLNSSLNYLKSLEVEEVSIGRSFDESEIIVKRILELLD